MELSVACENRFIPQMEVTYISNFRDMINFNKNKHKPKRSVEKTYDFAFDIYCVVLSCQTLVRT